MTTPPSPERPLGNQYCTHPWKMGGRHSGCVVNCGLPRAPIKFNEGGQDAATREDAAPLTTAPCSCPPSPDDRVIDLMRLADRDDGRQRTHWEGCEASHPECLARALAAALRRERERAEDFRRANRALYIALVAERDVVADLRNANRTMTNINEGGQDSGSMSGSVLGIETAPAPPSPVPTGDCSPNGEPVFHPPSPLPTMQDAVAAGDGTLHGAIDHWQKVAEDAAAALLREREAVDRLQQRWADNAPAVEYKRRAERAEAERDTLAAIVRAADAMHMSPTMDNINAWVEARAKWEGK